MSILGLIHKTYKFSKKKKFTAKEKIMLRPLAESIAILDGNGFFGLSRDENGDDNWYEQYLIEAWMIYKSNPSVIKGTSWYLNHVEHENATVEDAYNNWLLIKMLSRKN